MNPTSSRRGYSLRRLILASIERKFALIQDGVDYVGEVIGGVRPA
jgi:hypothetical protein